MNVEVYPGHPGFKEGSTSRDAAIAAAPTAVFLREMCLARLAVQPSTADEVAEWCNASVLAIRPRFSELRHEGKIYDTGIRRSNISGRSAKVWALLVTV